MKAKLFATASALAFASSLAFSVHAQGGSTDQADTVSACGTANHAPAVGIPGPITETNNGVLCTNATITGNISTAAVGVTSTDHSGNVTSGGNFTIAVAASSSRKGCLIENPTTATEVLYVNFTGNATAATTNSFSLSPGASINCATQNGAVLTDSISVEAATTNHAFVATSQ